MAPKFNAAQLDEFLKLGQALAKRTAPLSEAGGKSLQHMAPEAQVALDQALTQGAQLGEVQGPGTTTHLLPIPDYRAGQPEFMDPLKPVKTGYNTMTRAGEALESGQAEAIANAHPDPAGTLARQAAGRVQDAQLANINHADESGNLTSDSWPRAWQQWENIPAAVGTVGAGAALLGASRAQAAAPEGFEPDPAPAGFEPDMPEGFEPDPVQAAPEPDLTGGMSVGQPAQEPEFGGQTEADYTNTEAQTPPIEQLFAPAEKFKKHYITPILKAAQEFNRSVYFGGSDPNSGLKPGGLGGYLRANKPAMALNAESVGKLALGQTDMNTPGSEVPEVRDALAQAEQNLGPTLGPLYSAAAQSFGTEFSNLPFFLIPGIGSNPIVQGATGGGLSALADPEQSVMSGTLGGGAMGGVIGGGIKVVQKVGGAVAQKLGARQAKKLSEFLPIAVLPAEDEGKLADAIFNTPEQATPVDLPTELATPAPKAGGTAAASPRAKQRSSPLAVAIDVLPDGSPTAKGLHLTPDGLHSSKPPANYKGKIVATQRAVSAAIDNPTGPVAKAINGDWQPGMVLAPEQQWQKGKVSPEEFPAYVADGYKLMDDVREGSVLVLEGNGGQGTARLYDVNDPKLQREILKRRMLTEVTLPDGKKVKGYLNVGNSDEILLPPEASENIPGATVEGVDLAGMDEGKIRVLSNREIDDVLLSRQAVMEQAEDDIIRGQADQQAAQEDIALGGNGNGDKLPPPPPMDPPPPPPPQPHNVDPVEEMRLSWWQRAGNQLNRWTKAPTVYGPRDVSDKAMMAFSVNTFENLRDSTFKALVKSTPQLTNAPVVRQREVQSSIARYITGDLSYSQMIKNNPELAQKGYELAQAYKNQIARNEQTLRELNVLGSGEDMTQFMKLPDDEAIPGYATRMYYRFLLEKGEWSRLLFKDKAKTARLINDIKRDVFGHENYKHWTPEAKDIEARKYLELLSGDEVRLEEAATPGTNTSSYLAEGQKSLKQRNELRGWEKEALGQVDNAYLRVAETITRQEQLILQGEMWKSVMENRSISTFADQPEVAARLGHSRQLPMDPHKFGRAAGFRVSPDTYYALVTAPRAQKNASMTINRFSSMLKYGQTVGNPGSWVTNFFANAQGAALSNLVDPFTAPATVGMGMVKFGQDLAEHSKAPGLRETGGQKRWMRAMELGIIGSEYSTAEFRKSASQFAKALDKEMQSNPDKVVDVLRWFPEQLKKGKDVLSSLYSSIDSLWKYSTYVTGMQKGGIGLDGKVDVKKAIDFIGSRYRPQMSTDAIREAVELEVARRIHFSFPMMDRVGETVRKAGASNLIGPVLNPYIKVKSELVRNYAQLPKRVLTEKGMPANLMKYGLVAGGAVYGLKALREHAGVQQQEVDNAFATAPRAHQRFKPGATALWYREPSGELASLDMTQLFEPLTWLQGDPHSSAPTKFMQSMALNGIDGSLAEDPIVDLLATSGMIPPSYHKRPVPEWQRGGSRMLAEGLGTVGPGVIRNTYNTITKTQGMGFEPPRVRGPTVPQLSPQTGMTNLLAGPSRVTPVGSAEQATREIQALAREIDQAKRELADVGLMREGQSSGILTAPLEKKAAMQKARAVLDQKVARMKQMQNQLRSSQLPPGFEPD